MLYLTLKRTQCLRSFEVNATAFSTLIYREKTGKSKKHKQFLLKNLRIEYFNSIISKTSLTKFFISSSMMMQDTYLRWLLVSFFLEMQKELNVFSLVINLIRYRIIRGFTFIKIIAKFVKIFKTIFKTTFRYYFSKYEASNNLIHYTELNFLFMYLYIQVRMGQLFQVSFNINFYSDNLNFYFSESKAIKNIGFSQGTLNITDFIICLFIFIIYIADKEKEN